MLKPKKRLTKKEIKEDKFVQKTMQAKAYVEENYQKVMGIVAGIFAVILLIMVISYYRGQSQQEANALLGEAQLEYHNLNYTKAKAMLNRLMEEYSGTDAADQGKFLMANLYYREGKYKEAKEYFKDFLDNYSGSEILIASAIAGYAACIAAEGNYLEAAENYRKAQEKAPDFVEAANYLYLAGLNYQKADQPEQAQEMFQKVVENYKDSSRYNDAKAQLIFLTIK